MHRYGPEHERTQSPSSSELVVEPGLAQLADDLRELADCQAPSALGQLPEEGVDVVTQPVVLPRGELEEVTQNAGVLDVGLNGVEVLLLTLSEMLPEVAARGEDQWWDKSGS